jgi:hypothetical protein
MIITIVRGHCFEQNDPKKQIKNKDRRIQYGG